MADISKIKTPDGTTYNIKDTTARSQSGVTGVKGNAESSYRTGQVNLTAANVGAAPSDHYHWPNRLSYSADGYMAISGDIDMVTGARIGAYASNKSFGLPANAITIEYSNNGGTSWTDYGATDSQKRDLFAETRGTNFYIGKSTTGSAKSLNDRLRVTIEPTDRYVNFNAVYLWFSTQGNTCVIDLERSTIGAKDTYTTVFTDKPISGWSGNNIVTFPSGMFGGGSTQTSNNYKYRLTFRMTALSSTTYAAGVINDIRFLGTAVYSSPNNMVAKNHLYTWDSSLNATFPFKVTASGGFSGALTGNASTSTGATNLSAYSGNETTIGANSLTAGASTNDTVWFNYRDVYGGSTSNNATKIGAYHFGNRKGTVSGVTVYADTFNGKLTGNVTGNVSGTAANVTGTVAVANGGTGKTTANDAANNLISGLPAWTANPTDDTYFVRQDIGGTSTFGRVKFSTLWNYIKGKFSGTSPITFSNGAIGINTASTSGYGATKLSTATNSTATDLAATPSAVKTAYDLANTANGTANTALSGVNGNLIYDHTFTISNGVATFTPHVYQKGSEVTTNYAKSCFTWKYRLIDGSEVTLTTKNDRGCDVTITNLGYGGHVIGIFTPA